MPDISDAPPRRITQSEELNSGLSGLFSDKPEEARELLRTIAAKWDAGSENESVEAIRLYSGMASSLSEEDFRWACAASPLDRKKLRRHRFIQYQRFCELFELEIGTTLKSRRLAMSQGSDWSHLEAYCADTLLFAKAKALLKLAAWMFRLQVPGAADVCDWAAWKLYASAYRAA